MIGGKIFESVFFKKNVNVVLCFLLSLLFPFSFFRSFRTQTFAYPESPAEREEILQGLQGRIEDIKSVSVEPINKSSDFWLLW